MVHHGAGLRKVTRNDKFVKQLIRDYRKVGISEKERSMLDYVAKLTREPWKMEEKDVKVLRDVGFTDIGILDINQVTGYYAYVNRLADGLGVELEPFWEEKDLVF